MDKKKISTFSYKLVQISPSMILVNSGAFLSISSWFCKLTELIFVMIPYISSTGYPPPPQNARDYGSWASSELAEISNVNRYSSSIPRDKRLCLCTDLPNGECGVKHKENFGFTKYLRIIFAL